jgi:superfamily II DNA or RNA helicase
MRDYQEKCVEAGLKEQRGIIEIATGGGKTLIAANLIRRIGRPALFLVHTRDLMYQTIAVFRRELGIEIGSAGDGKIDLHPVTVATVQTCARAMDIKLDQSPDDDEVLEPETSISGDSATDLQQFIKTTPVVFFDECHHLPADTAYSLAMEMEGALWRYGLSATPYRADRQDMLMEAALGPKIFSARASMLIELGYLVPPVIKFLPVPPLTVKNGKADYQEIYTSYVIENKKRNRLIADTAREMAASGKSVLILVNQVRHGEHLQEMLPGVPLVQGADAAEDRDKVFKDLCAKKQMIVIATTLADEGLDVPSLDCVILASAGRSETRALQRLGRALRLAPEKTGATVIDFMDNAPYLREHAANRLELFRTEPKFTVEY